MKHVIPSIILLITLSASCTQKEVNRTTNDTHQEVAVAELYLQHCGGCHGANMEGASATTLIKDDWVYGRRRSRFIRNITYGINAAEMPAFEHILDDESIGALADYIIEAQDISPTERRNIPDQIQTKDYVLTVETVVETGLEVPWAIEFVDEDHALISERGGQLTWLINGILDTARIKGLPVPHTASSTGGFMDIALDPDYEHNGWIYLSYSHTNDDVLDKEAPALTKIVRGKIEMDQWLDQQTLFEVPDSLMPTNGNRWGCRFLFDPEGNLLFTIGDMAKDMDAQNLGKATGKVFRIRPDGSIPEDNPFINDPNALPAIFTIGNRNTQGLALHPITQEIWSTDHGPMGGDELNILKKGANYGWPIITYGRDYSGDIVSELTKKEGMEQPIIQWTPSIAVCAAEFCTSPHFAKWKHQLLIGALSFEELRLISLEGQKVVDQELILKNLGRVRDVKFSPKGKLYIILNNPDVIISMMPNNNNKLI